METCIPIIWELYMIKNTTDDLNYYLLGEDSSVFRKFYNANDDLRQYYVEVSDELNSKLKYIIQQFEEIGFPPLEVMNMAICIGFGRCEEFAKLKILSDSFIHSEVLKDYEKAKDDHYLFEKV
jgi:hypothetical protein